jgi:hypothetical protein
VALLPLYLKQHSYGEYVFDWSWADAYERHGLAYYPKLLSAIPYTPATGPRLCSSKTLDAALCNEVVTVLQQHANTVGASSLHWLFPEPTACQQLSQAGLAARMGVQFHWFNHGFSSFDDFVSSFSSRKRKNLLKERRRVAEQGLLLERRLGTQTTAGDWQRFHYFYQLTYAKRSGHGGYLPAEFFTELATTMPEQLLLVSAQYQGETVAAALNFIGNDTLYGRYWGCSHDFEYLHFEACYYQGIEFCIEHGLSRFDPGAQGEHKIQRGFTPVRTWSNHWLAHPDFAAAVDDFLDRDRIASEQYLRQASELLPFKNS